MSTEGGADERLARRLERRRTLARTSLWFERLWPAFWPAIGLVGAFVVLALLDIPALLSPWLHTLLLAAFAIAIVVALWRGLAGLVAPDAAAADRRLETASGLLHRPLAALADQPAQDDPAAQVLWQAHLARAAASLGRLRVGLPHPHLAARDRRALRGGLVVALVAGLVVAGGDTGPRLARALTPGFTPGAGPPAPLVQAWITPPAYTGVAPLFLKRAETAVTVPAGSHLAVSVTGGNGRPVLAYAGHDQPFRTLAADSFQAESTITTGGRLEIRRQGSTVAGWTVTALADLPPTASWNSAPGQGRQSLETRLPWRVGDDYGVVSLQAELRLRDRPQAKPLIVQIPLPGAPKSAHGAALNDLTANPWAGLPVVAKLVARDTPGQTGTSDTVTFVLPERDFHNPVAQALVAVRKMLALHPEDRVSALRALGAVASDSDAFDQDLGAYLNLAAIGGLLIHDPASSAIDEAQARLWQLALHMEDGVTERTLKALTAARQAVRDALNRAAHDQFQHPERMTKDQAEIERRLNALRQAIQQHLQALAEQAKREGLQMPFDPNMAHLSNRDIDRMAQSIENAARQGRLDDAKRQMAELEQLLDQLRMARLQNGRGQRNAQQQQRGRQQMGALQDMVQRQGGLLNHAEQRAQDAPGQFGQQQRAQQAPERSADGRVQQALRRALGELMQQFGDLTGKIPQSLGEADLAMQRAGQALGQGKDEAAGTAQRQAIEALQKGGQQMAQQMARQFGMAQGQGQDQGQQDGTGIGLSQDGMNGGDDRGYANDQGQGGWRRGDSRDPLGRPLDEGGNGTDESSSVRVPDKMDAARSRQIEQELRRRDAQRTRPQEELNYIGRLLKPF